MRTYIHCKLDGSYRVFAIEDYLTYEDVMGLMALEEVKPDGAVMLTYVKLKKVK